jgi:hypothetical protein
MKSRTTRSINPPMLWAVVILSMATAGGSVRADGIYSITGLGTLSGQSSSVATSINNSGQVVGISYNSSDGYFAQTTPGNALPPRFTETGSGAQSFLYSNGQISPISPPGGLAMSINDSGQVVGGANSSINNAGQYVGGQSAGVQVANPGVTSYLMSGGATTTLSSLFVPYSINNTGTIAGFLVVDAHGGNDYHPAIYQNGQITDLFSKVASGEYFDSRAIAINQKGDMLITVQQYNGTSYGSQIGPLNSYIYNASTGQATNLTALPGGSGMIAAALNDKDQVVGNGFLYSNGSIESLVSLLPLNSGWSSLNATAINDFGQIVGQGTYNGQLEAFEMTPTAQQVPEPASVAVWCAAVAAAAISMGKRRRRGGETDQDNS